MLAPWDFGLIDASTNSPNWDKDTCHEHYQGKGKWLYEPASDDPELCPGGDWSRYLCDAAAVRQAVLERPGRPDLPHVRGDRPGRHADPKCSIISRRARVRTSMGLSAQLERQLDYLATYGGHNYQCVLGNDFAPHSFDFALYRPGAKDARKFFFNGGLIYQGPSCPADGSFPSLTVSLASGTGWFCHT